MTNYYSKGVQLTSLLSGYNSSGTTTGFNNMGSFTSVLSTYRKPSPLGFLQNGNDLSNLYEAFYIANGTPNSTVNTTVPSWATKANLYIQGSGSAGGAMYVDTTSGAPYYYSGGSGGSGAIICCQVNVSSGQSVSLFCGQGGLFSAGNNGGTGQSSSITINGLYLSASSGSGGIYGGGTQAGGLGGTISGNLTYSNIFNGVSNGSGGKFGNNGNSSAPSVAGALSGYLIAKNNFQFSTSTIDTTYQLYGQGGNSEGTNASGTNGNNGFVSIHFLA